MTPQRSVYVVACSDRWGGVEAACERVAMERPHAVGVELWCPRELEADAWRALAQAQQHWPWVPPVRRDPGPAVGSAVVGLPTELCAALPAVHGRLAALRTGPLGDLALLGVLGSDPGPLELALTHAWTLLAQRGDVLLAVDRADPVPLVHGRVAATPTLPFDRLVEASTRPPASELHGVLTERAADWLYEVFHRERLVDRVVLSERLGAALSSVVLAPGADPHELHRLAHGGRWDGLDESLEAHERRQDRVHQWFRRLRTKLEPWATTGLEAFVPERGSRRVVGTVHVRQDAALPWLPFPAA